MATPALFSSFSLRGLTLRNRIVVSPMCEYSSDDGFANDWHLVHLGSRAVGGAGLILTEATHVSPAGRITPRCLGIWKDEQVEMLARIVRFLKSQGTRIGVQLAHAGRKGSTAPPFEGGKGVADAEGGWTPVAPSPLAFSPSYRVPAPLDEAGIAQVRAEFLSAARRALAAGFETIELHAAHGYLFHQFLSPLSNQRTDHYGGSFENRTRLLLETVRDMRAFLPEAMPLLVRLSCTDWLEGGWDLEQSVELAHQLRAEGVDLIDCSSGGTSPEAKIPTAPLYQVPFAERLRRETGIATGAVGLITEPAEAEGIVQEGKADLVFLAREFLREPYWPMKAAKALGIEPVVPKQYGRAFQ